MAFGFLSASMALAAVVGPVLGGLLVAYVSWQSAFLVNVPICLVVAGLVFRYVPAAESARRSHQLDLVGVVLVIAGLGAVTYGFIAGNRHGWGVIAGPVTVPGLFAAGVVLLGVFAWWERRRREPLLPLVLFSSRSFSIALWLAVLQFVLMFGLMLIVTLNVQQVRGGSAFVAGLVFLPMALGAGVASPFAGHITDRWGGRTVITAGFVSIGVAIGWLSAVLTPDVSSVGLVGPLGMAGLGVGLVMAPISAEAIKALPPELVNTGSGVLTTGRQVASALGVAVVGAMLQVQSAGQPLALLVLGVFALVGAVSAWLLPTPGPRERLAVAEPASSDQTQTGMT
jgi:MFS family permease